MSSDQAALGQNVLCATIEEVNFMARVEGSRRAPDREAYDQAESIYRDVENRRKSRFARFGRLPGLLCLVSSSRYPGQFTDQKIKEAKSNPRIYAFNYPTWGTKPKETFSGSTFRVFVGDAVRRGRIVVDDETLPVEDQERTIAVPVEFRENFERDTIEALRSLAGVSILASRPFLLDAERVSRCFGRRPSILNVDETAGLHSGAVITYPARFERPDLPRFVHVDLGLSRDAAGIACGFVREFVTTSTGERAPVIILDFVLRVLPPPNAEIEFAGVRRLLSRLRDEGLPIRWVTFDLFQSADSRQILAQHGFTTGYQSIDRVQSGNAGPYDVLKTALYDQRIEAPNHRVALRELLSLEQDARTGRIDHTPHGSKDCGDAIAGVVYGLARRREVYALMREPVVQHRSNGSAVGV
jgi:hypothetical protein